MPRSLAEIQQRVEAEQRVVAQRGGSDWSPDGEEPAAGGALFERTYEGELTAPDDLVIEIRSGGIPAGDGDYPLTDLFYHLSILAGQATAAGVLRITATWEEDGAGI